MNVYGSLAGPETAYFVMETTHRAAQTFTFAATDAETIAHFRAVLYDPSTPDRRVAGKIARGREPYNPDWNFHFIPETVRPNGAGHITCSDNPIFVEDKIEKVGTDYMRDHFWCPGYMQIVQETHMNGASW